VIYTFNIINLNGDLFGMRSSVFLLYFEGEVEMLC
jgi:hypothetical protein